MEFERFRLATEALGLRLSSSQVDAFAAFEGALYNSNLVMNLTRVPQEEAWTRHFLDSLLINDLIGDGASVLDIGTGPGFPAWPLACARPDLQVTALDSNGKMLGFLASQRLPNLQIIRVRAEEYATKEKFDVVTGRAVARLAAQLEISARPCKIKGRVIPLRTPADLSSLEPPILENLGLKLMETVHAQLPATEIVRMLPVYIKVARGKAGYPRRWAEIRNDSLAGPE